MCQALPEPPSLRLPPIYGPPPRQQPGPPHHQLPQSLPPPPRHEALPPPLPQRLPPIPPIPPRQPLPQSDSVGQSHGIPHFLPPPPWIGRHEGNQHRRIIQWLGVGPQNPIVLISTNTQDASQFPEYMDREVNPDFDFDDFFFQAEDGIRHYKVTGVQTCALPISEPIVEDGRLRGVVVETKSGRQALLS